MPIETVLVIDDSPTILKVVTTNLRRAGFEVITARDGRSGIAAMEEKVPQVILLDLVMPGMNGVEFCHALRGMGDLARVPVVLMSAKGDKLGASFVKGLGAVESITKPFSPEALIALVERVISACHDGLPDDTLVERVAAIGREELGPLEYELDDLDTAPLTRQKYPRDERALREAAEQLAGRVADILTSAIPELSAKADEIEEALTTRLTPKALETIGSTVAQALPQMRSADLSGDLAQVPLSDILSLLQAHEMSGCAVIEGTSFTMRIFLQGGTVSLAQSLEGPNEFLLGRFVVEDEFIDKEELARLLQDESDRALLGQRLVKQGYLSHEELATVLERQTAELVYEALRWRRGTCEFRTNVASPEAELAQLGIKPETLLVEGARRAEEWRQIEQKIDASDAVFLRDDRAIEGFGRGQLTQEEQSVLALIDGHRSLGDLVEATQMGSFPVSKILYRLLLAHLVHKRS